MIAIKDFSMPSCCMNCGLLGKDEMYCSIYPRRDLDVITVATSRPDWCPLVEVEEYKVGKWIFSEGTKGKDNVEKCSCCGSHWKEAIIYRTDTKEYLRTRLLYCPNCGAEMRGSENE